jgi:hypothetical protein
MTHVLAAARRCPPGAKLTYQTSPAGATLYEGGQSLGIAPVTKPILPPANGAQIRTPEVTAVWPSGAKTVVLDQPESRATTTSPRCSVPPGAPNLQAD